MNKFDIDKSYLMGIGIVMIFILVLAINLGLMPFLLMIVFNALGHEISFWVALAIWVLVAFMLNFIRSLIVHP